MTSDVASAGATRARVGVLISGRGSNMIALAEAAERDGCPYEVVLVAANDPDAPGLARARMMGLPTWGEHHRGKTREAFDRAVDAELLAAGAQFVALAGYMRLLSPWFVEKWAGRVLNIHPSLLPKYKGLDTHARAIAAGDTEAGVSVHVVTAELDDGPVVAQARVAVQPDDTPDTLAARVLVEEHLLYPKALAEFVTR